MEMWNDCQKSILFEAYFIGKNSRQKWNCILLMGRNFLMNEARRFSSIENQNIKMHDKQQQKYELVNKHDLMNRS